MEQIKLYIIVIGISLFVILYFLKIKKIKWIKPGRIIPMEFKLILETKVNYYVKLNPKNKLNFEYQVHEFLLNHRITGVGCDLTITDNLLVAASAVIPTFNFPNWNYSNLYDVFIYPDSFNKDHEITGEGRTILGMVGTGYMDGKMILSKRALYHGFDNLSDKKNTAIHEFVHLIDKIDGDIDGVPKQLLHHQYAIPWIDLMQKKINEIRKGKSDINEYGGTSNTEFFAVASEYFFERPKLLAKKHPVLYQYLEDMFNQNMKSMGLFSNAKQQRVKRNDSCPCKSGDKFKHCCGKIHYP